MNYDLILEELGEFGPWQRLIAVMLWLPAMIDGIEIMIASVAGLNPDRYRCKFDTCNNDDGSYFPDADNELLVNSVFPKMDTGDDPDYCRHYAIKPDAQGNCDFANIPHNIDNTTIKECTLDDEYFFDSFQMDETYITEFKMVCGRKIETPLVNSFFMIGLMIGSFAFGVLSDKFGRRNTLIPAILCAAGGSLIGAFMPEYFSMVLFRMIAGAGAEGCFLIPFVLSMEIVGIKEKIPFLPWVSYSTLLANFLSVPLAGGEALAASFGYFIKKWRTMQWILSLICLSFGLTWFFIPESPRWLISNARYKDAKALMEKAAKRNNKKISDELLQPPSGEEEIASEKAKEAGDVETVGQEKDDGQYGLSDLFHPSVRVISLVMFVCWPVITLLYYGLTFAADKLPIGGGDSFLSMILISLIEIPSYLFLIVTQDVAGRKPLFVMCMLLPGIGCIGAAFLKEGAVFTVLVLLSKFCISAAFNLTYVYTIELYPTNIRNSAVGICSTMARFGGIAAPWIGTFLPEQGSLPEWVPLFTFGMTAFVGGSLALLLPDTIGFSLPDTFTDLENIKKNSKPMWKCAKTSKDEDE